MTRLLFMGLVISILFNFFMAVQYEEYFSSDAALTERYHSGSTEDGVAKIALLEVNGTIMPPFTERLLRAIKQAHNDPMVKGVVLAIDSPGGFVADSHQIFHRLSALRKQKPIIVVMKRMAASGGYYIAMGAGKKGKIYAEPTTWTGSIGVIIPRYNAKVFAEKVGITSDPLKTGEFKDALSPFRDLTENERAVWETILDDAFTRFLGVIADNRTGLDEAAVRKLATGQIYTAIQAKENGLIDEIGYEEDAIEALKKQLDIAEVRVVTYQFPLGLWDVLAGNVRAQQPQNQWRALIESTVPRAMYYCSWGLGVPGW